MTVMTLTEAKQELTSKIADRLRQSLKASAAVGAVSKAILEGLLADRDSVVALTALLNGAVAVEAPGDDLWLKTEEAAKEMGFSRPYVNALIDAGEFGSSASKTAKGHRRVKASAVKKWLRDHEVSPERIAQAESSDAMEEFFEVPELSSKESAKLAKRIEQARRDSLHHRPAPKLA